MKLLHIDDHVLFAEGLSAVLKQRSHDLQVISSNEAEQAFTLLEKHLDTDIILVDLSMPGLDGVAFIQGLEQREIYIPVAVLSASEDLWKIKQALAAGASGFIPKTYSSETILAILTQVIGGDIFIPEKIQLALSNLPSQEPGQEQQKILSAYQLGQRQLDVLKLMQQGYANEEIASVLNLSINTIKTHARTLFSSFQVANRLECVRYAERIGLLE